MTETLIKKIEDIDAIEREAALGLIEALGECIAALNAIADGV